MDANQPQDQPLATHAKSDENWSKFYIFLVVALLLQILIYQLLTSFYNVQ